MTCFSVSIDGWVAGALFVASVGRRMDAGAIVSELNSSPRPVDIEPSREIPATSTLSKSQYEPSRDQSSESSGGRVANDFVGAEGYSSGHMKSIYGGGTS